VRTQTRSVAGAALSTGDERRRLEGDHVVGRLEVLGQHVGAQLGDPGASKSPKKRHCVTTPHPIRCHRTQMADERENFTSATHGIISGRAGYRCCFLGCARVTVGPGSKHDEIASIGVACHIFSAASGGPRGQGALTAEQLKAPENGFWACQDHAKLIDTNAGKRYPAGLLLGWRALHEARIHREMGGIRLPINWVEGIEIVRSPVRRTRDRRPLFRAGERLTLSRVTLLIGANDSGKTALCDWLGGSAEEGSLWRWLGADLSFKLTVHNPEAHVFAVDSVGGAFMFRLDDVVVPFNPLPVVVQTLEHPLHPRHEQESDADWLARCLGVTRGTLKRLAASLEQGNPFVESMSIGESGEIEAKIRVEKKTFDIRAFGGSSMILLTLGLAFARASYTSLHVPTLLVLDGAVASLDTHKNEWVLGELGTATRFQTLATTPRSDKSLTWGGWSVVNLKDDAGGAVFEVE
jgi:hypothetical protein